MTKSTITKTWIAGLVVFAAGIVIVIVGALLMLGYGGTFTHVSTNPNQYNFTPDLNGFFWTTISVIVVGAVIALIGGIVQLVAWIGGLVNSYLLPEKTWFTVMLIGGLVSLLLGLGFVGLAVMLAYVIAAPDGTPYRKPQVPIAPQPTTFAQPT